MLNKDIKRKIDNSRDILVGQLPLPSDQIELITVTLIFKFMNDIDEQSRSIGGEISFFKDELKDYTWLSILSNQLGADERVTKFIHAVETIAKAKHIPELFKSIFRNTFLKFRDGKILKRFLDEINGFEYNHSEELGNAFEYLLSSMGAQGENGQFRTPRNIIDFITEVVDPDKEDKILDPACGTAGFLISAYKHILRKHTTGYEDYRISLNNYETEGISIHWGDKLSQTNKEKLSKRIEGYDITPLMVRLSQVNMYLHHFPNPKIHDYDTLSNKNRWEDKYDCILANPPFMTPKGGVEPHSDFRIRAKKAEVLFSDYIIEHLTPNGKAGWIVPEGIIFQNSGDYVELRKWLVNDMGLWAVVSLPAQIFQPYSGVKTTILLVDRALARTTQNIILVKVENDGFSLNTNRTPIKDNDLPEALNLLTEYKKNPGKFKENEEAYKNDHKIKFTILSRKDFARLDSYKSATAGLDFYKRAYKQYLKAKETYEEKIAQEKDDNKIKRIEASFEKQKLYFLEVTGSGVVPATEEKLKEEFEKQFKEDIISYGEDAENNVKLTREVKKYLDNEREFNLSIDRANKNFQLNTSYDLVKLVDCCEIIAGQSPKSENYNNEGNGLAFYQGKTNFGNKHLLAPSVWTSEITKVSVKNDVLFSMRAPVGEVNINPFDEICIGRGLAAIRPQQSVLYSYLFYLLNTIKEELKNFGSNGAVFDSITKDKLEEIEIPLPPIEIQQKIVDEIEGYQKVIDGCNLIIENYKPNFKIDESWERVRLGELCKNYDSRRIPISSKERMSGEIPYYGASGIVDYVNDYLFEEELLLISEDGANLLSRTSPIAFSINGKTWVNNHAHVLKFDNKLLQSWVEYYINVTDISQYITGAAQPKLNQDNLNKIEIPVPINSELGIVVNSIKQSIELIKSCNNLKTQMEIKIKEVIDGVWGKVN